MPVVNVVLARFSVTVVGGADSVDPGPLDSGGDNSSEEPFKDVEDLLGGEPFEKLNRPSDNNQEEAQPVDAEGSPHGHVGERYVQIVHGLIVLDEVSHNPEEDRPSPGELDENVH